MLPDSQRSINRTICQSRLSRRRPPPRPPSAARDAHRCARGRRASAPTWSPTPTPRPRRPPSRCSATHRPDDAIVGEEGTDRRRRRRAPLVGRRHRRHGRLRRRHPDAGAARSCSRTSTARTATAVYDPARRAAHRRARRRARSSTASRSQIRDAAHARSRPTSPSSCARTGSSSPASARPPTGSSTATGLIRHAGPGTLELAWVAAGRLDAWIQPDTDPWDWLPGALLVTEAGGEARVDPARRRAGTSPDRQRWLTSWSRC